MATPLQADFSDDDTATPDVAAANNQADSPVAAAAAAMTVVAVARPSLRGNTANSPGHHQKKSSGGGVATSRSSLSSNVGTKKKETCTVAQCMNFCYRDGHCLRHVYRTLIVQSQESELEREKYTLLRTLVDSERQFVEDLEKAVHQIETRLVWSLQLGKQILAAREIERVFGNLEDVHKLHARMLVDFDEIDDEGVVVRQMPYTLLHYANHMKRVYGPYIGNFQTVGNVLKSLLANNKEFCVFVQMHEQCFGIKLWETLKSPITRIPHYLKTLSALKKLCQHGKDDAYAVLVTNVHATLKAMAKSVNEALPHFAHLNVLKDANDEFVRNSSFVDIVADHRRLVLRAQMRFGGDAFRKSRNAFYTVMLFNDILVYGYATGSRLTMRNVIPLHGTRADPQIGARHKDTDLIITGFKMPIKGENSLTLVCDSALQRDEWLAALRKSIEESDSLPKFVAPKQAAAFSAAQTFIFLMVGERASKKDGRRNTFSVTVEGVSAMRASVADMVQSGALSLQAFGLAIALPGPSTVIEKIRTHVHKKKKSIIRTARSSRGSRYARI